MVKTVCTGIVWSATNMNAVANAVDAQRDFIVTGKEERTPSMVDAYLMMCVPISVSFVMNRMCAVSRVCAVPVEQGVFVWT